MIEKCLVRGKAYDANKGCADVVVCNTKGQVIGFPPATVLEILVCYRLTGGIRSFNNTRVQIDFNSQNLVLDEAVVEFRSTIPIAWSSAVSLAS